VQNARPPRGWTTVTLFYFAPIADMTERRRTPMLFELEEKYLLISILTSAKRDTIKLLNIDRPRELDPKFEQLLNEKIDLINSLLSKLDNLDVKKI
jgi:hypothetical protein